MEKDVNKSLVRSYFQLARKVNAQVGRQPMVVKDTEKERLCPTLMLPLVLLLVLLLGLVPTYRSLNFVPQLCRAAQRAQHGARIWRNPFQPLTLS